MWLFTHLCRLDKQDRRLKISLLWHLTSSLKHKLFWIEHLFQHFYFWKIVKSSFVICLGHLSFVKKQIGCNLWNTDIYYDFTKQQQTRCNLRNTDIYWDLTKQQQIGYNLWNSYWNIYFECFECECDSNILTKHFVLLSICNTFWNNYFAHKNLRLREFLILERPVDVSLV